ncbi:hypothetical protein D3C75_1173620 [compost metagenome]
MVIGHGDHIHSGILQSIPNLKRTVELGIGGQPQLLPAGNALLVGHQQIRLNQQSLHRLQHGFKIKSAVLGAGIIVDAVMNQYISDRSQ